jgi:acid stress chaperone HdeB
VFKLRAHRNRTRQKEDRVTRSAAIILVGLALFSSSTARAQETIDVSKITCDQWMATTVADPHDLAMWLSGFYHSKRNNTIIEVQEFQAHIKKLQRYCIDHPERHIMQAVEDLFKVAKKY